MNTENMHHKNSAVGKAAFVAAAAKKQQPYTPGFVFEHEGGLYRVTEDNAAGFRSYFRFERVPSIALYIQTFGRFKRPVPNVELVEFPPEALERIRAMAAEAPAEPFGFPLGEAACACCAEGYPDQAEDVVGSATAEPATTDRIGRLEDALALTEARARTAEMREEIIGAARDRFASDLMEARRELSAYGYTDEKASVALLIDRAIDGLRVRAERAEDIVKKKETHLQSVAARANELERELWSIKDIVNKADLIPF